MGALAAVEQHGAALQWVSPELQADEEVVMAAVTRSGAAIRDASEELRGHRPIVLAAVKKCGAALAYASPELKVDKELVQIPLGEQPQGPQKLYSAKRLYQHKIPSSSSNTIGQSKRARSTTLGPSSAINATYVA